MILATIVGLFVCVRALCAVLSGNHYYHKIFSLLFSIAGNVNACLRTTQKNKLEPRRKNRESVEKELIQWCIAHWLCMERRARRVHRKMHIIWKIVEKNLTYFTAKICPIITDVFKKQKKCEVFSSVWRKRRKLWSEPLAFNNIYNPVYHTHNIHF